KQVIGRFEAERQALAMMEHPNIATALDAGTTETGRPYFVMELVRGLPITEFCDKNSLTHRNVWSCSSRFAMPSSMHINAGSFTGISSPPTSW
ncbi:MAG: hypothetical protein ACYS14_07565, partial [Planctomycetota bacterium]